MFFPTVLNHAMGVKRDALDWPLNMIEYEKRESTLIYSEQTA